MKSGRAENELAMEAAELLVEAGRIFRFGLVGICATLVYALMTTAAVEIFWISAVPASILGQGLSAGVSYLGHSIYTFRVKSDYHIFLWRFMVIAGLTLATTVAVTWIFTDIVGLPHRMTIAIVSILIPTTNYLCNRFWVFRLGLASASSVSGVQPAKFDTNQT
jgi:putative flippase GtrA